MAETEAGSSRNLVAEKFSPMGIRVLAVDDDAVCLKMLEGLLLACGYKVTVAQNAITALELLRENKGSYDLVISDVKMPDMDGFKLSETIGFEMGLPVIMLSIDSEVETVMEGIKHGACDYLVKPVRIEELRLIWKHVMKKALQGTKGANDGTDKPDTSSKLEEDNTSNSSRKLKDQTMDREDESNDSDEEEPSTQKKPRVNWSGELHAKFIDAINKLGLDRAVPKKILDLMDVPWITRENVASHLQKYRKALKKNSLQVSQQYNAGGGSSGYGANAATSLLMSFNNQGPNVSSLGGYRVEGYQNHQRTIPLVHIQQSRTGHNPMTPTWSPINMSQQTNARRHFSSTNQASQLRSHHFGSSSNPLVMETGIPQSASKHTIYQSLIPRLSQPSSFVENSSQFTRPIETNSCPTLVNQSVNVPNQPGSGAIFEHNSLQGDLKGTFTAGLDSLAPMQHQPHQFDAQTGEGLGVGNQVDGDSVVPESSKQKKSKGTSSVELLAPFLESPQEEPMFHLSNSNSTDDLHSVLKQFQGTKETTEDDDF